MSITPLTDLMETNMYKFLIEKGVQASEARLMMKYLQDSHDPDKWFKPEFGSELFSICGRLFNLKCICRMKIPVIKELKVKKEKLRFMYNFNLEY